MFAPPICRRRWPTTLFRSARSDEDGGNPASIAASEASNETQRDARAVPKGRTKPRPISFGLQRRSLRSEASVSEFDPGREASGTTRRSVLRAAGVIALAGAGASTLGACAADSSSGAPSDSPAAPTTSAPASPSPTADATSPKPSASKAKAPNGPSVVTSKVPVGGGVILEDADYVITQPSKGTYRAFSKICTHQGCPVASVSNGFIHCNCHGSEYSIKDGSVTNPPAPKPLARAKTTVFDGKVYVTG
jgi:Rieske Fe-S protein